MQVDGINLCHLGDLGHILSKDKLVEIGLVDILFIPIGGFYTIDYQQATQIMQDIQPKITIPMHYKTEVIKFPIDTLEPFIQDKDKVKQLKDKELEIFRENLPLENQIIILPWE